MCKHVHNVFRCKLSVEIVGQFGWTDFIFIIIIIIIIFFWK